MEILNGKELSARLKNKIAEQIATDYLEKGKQPPALACVLVGDDPASKIYVASKEKACRAVGMGSIIRVLPANSTEQEVESCIKELAADNSVSAILLQLPLPRGLNERKILNSIPPQKDADALTDICLGKLFSKTHTIAPCTASGIMELLKDKQIEISGKRAVVIGRSLLVGKSVANLLEQANATVTICHSKTQNLDQIASQADILIVAIGKPNFVTPNMVKTGAVVIDVGINRTENGIVGDVDYSSVAPKCSYITPVPGGVGPMTIAMLLSNTLTLAKEQEKMKEKNSEHSR
ncbi:MAG: bifunctional methylenetetrahydrofolate dehydrogenase/methenyltetrahydrofolate cyclohydrolase FolD [Clostridia bacterium]|nr:bifunctional methylenetetrahydrofolate dehydrogenase/methenyltetrahydrofolate cyclohydrolase FolD [Clostridia bacterium]